MKLHIGCGRSPKEGWLNCDVSAFPGVELVCSAVSIPLPDLSVSEILSEHMIEHLTYYEFNRFMGECKRLLRCEGKLTLECPDLEAVCDLFVTANDFQRYQTSYGYWPVICQIYGHQRGNSEAEILGQVHKSGYTEGYLRFVLEGWGFTDIEREASVGTAPGAPGLRLTARLP